MSEESICINCIYGVQPYGYYPIECLHGRRIVKMYNAKRSCKYYEEAPEPPEPPKQTPWQVIITEYGMGTTEEENRMIRI